MTSSPPRPWLRQAAAAVVVGLAAAHTATWFVVTGRMEAALPQIIAAAAHEGWRIEPGAAHRAGWPLRAAVHLDSITAVRDLGTAQLRWTAETLDLAITPTDPKTLRVSPGGTQSFSTGNTPPIVARADTMTVRVPLTGGPTIAEARSVSAQWPGGTVLRVATADLHWDGLALAASATGVAPTPPMAAPFNEPADFSARIVATQPFPPAATPGQSARQWQHAGGRAQVREFTLHLASLSVEGSGEGGLDRHLQPEAHATLRVRGAAEMLNAAAAAGLVEPGPASAARAVLGLLTLAAHGGPVSVPIDLADRTLAVSRFPLLQLPLLDWDGP